MSLYVYPDSHYGLQLGATHAMAGLYREGKRTLVHIPVAWPHLQEPKPTGLEPEELAIFALRPIRPGDTVGIYTSPYPRVEMAPITSVETLHLHDVGPDDLAALGRPGDAEDALAAYKKSWDECWSAEGFPWKSNPEVYAIRWGALK